MLKEDFDTEIDAHEKWLGEEFDPDTPLRVFSTSDTLVDMSLYGRNFSRAHFHNTHFIRCNFKQVNLRGAHFEKCTFFDCNFFGAHFEGARMESCMVTCSEFNAVRFDEKSVLYSTCFESTPMTSTDLTLPQVRNIVTDFPARKDCYDDIVSTFSYQRDFGIAKCFHIRIGCERHTIAHWVAHYKEIGKEAGYSKHQIRMYGQWIKMIKKERDRVKKINTESA